MLKHLSITNYAIIENLELEINKGFTVITGETGAGKSILLGALSLILGQRADNSVLNNKQKKCIVEGEFTFNKEDYINFFKENDLDFEPSNILRREISENGKSRAFINDTPVSLAILKELTSQLIDIHSQHQVLEIQDNRFQINVIDAFAELDHEVFSYANKFNNYSENLKRLNLLIETANNKNSAIDYITFQVKEIEDLALKPNEKENIQAELEIIVNAEEIKSTLESTSNLLIHSEQNLLANLKNVTKSFDKINHCSEDYKAIYDRLTSVIIELEDIASDVDKINNDFDFNPENLTYLNDRLSKIFSLEQKHNLTNTAEILELLENLKSQLLDSSSYEERILEQKNLIHQQKEELTLIANKISKKRKESFQKLIKNIISNLNQLGMADATFIINHQKLSELSITGIDKIDFLFSSNKGVEPKPLNKAASGGELSRLMLTIKSILAKNKNLATIIFDEIDSGVSGDIADKMAVIMKKISTNIQVIAITHLPQVAAKGETHIKIYKENVNGITKTFLTELTKNERIDELAKMLSGKKLSTAAIENAKVLLENDDLK
ncbi:MAG: DNA repair protein RecN [Bacteroidetes bacterium RIFCSPLOWO2_12_FULL_31_6]|nr:MAG: DNA repair protein RecN [Bacteroidetes bacterium RIFCSPLOWO2_12_FULL_31_6]